MERFIEPGKDKRREIPRAFVPRVRWSSDAMRRVSQDVEWARHSNPSGAAEIAGLLLGKPGFVTEILDCEPVFLVSESDYAEAFARAGKRRLQRAVAALEST